MSGDVVGYREQDERMEDGLELRAPLARQERVGAPGVHAAYRRPTAGLRRCRYGAVNDCAFCEEDDIER